MTSTGLAVTFCSAVLSPALVACLTKPTMTSNLKILIAVIITALCIILGQLFDSGLLTWPPDQQLWVILLATFGAQQFSYAVAKDKVVKPIEAATSAAVVQ